MCHCIWHANFLKVHCVLIQSGRCTRDKLHFKFTIAQCYKINPCTYPLYPTMHYLIDVTIHFTSVRHPEALVWKCHCRADIQMQIWCCCWKRSHEIKVPPSMNDGEENIENIRPCLLRRANAIAHHHTPKMDFSAIFSTSKSGEIIYDYIVHTKCTLYHTRISSSAIAQQALSKKIRPEINIVEAGVEAT